jgi:hypothetical protein
MGTHTLGASIKLHNNPNLSFFLPFLPLSLSSFQRKKKLGHFANLIIMPCFIVALDVRK